MTTTVEPIIASIQPSFPCMLSLSLSMTEASTALHNTGVGRYSNEGHIANNTGVGRYSNEGHIANNTGVGRYSNEGHIATQQRVFGI